MTISKKALWAKQLQLWPNSIELSLFDMYKWASNGATTNEKLARYMQLAMILQCPTYILYATYPKDGFIGCRFGLQDYEYLSNFGTWEGN